MTEFSSVFFRNISIIGRNHLLTKLVSFVTAVFVVHHIAISCAVHKVSIPLSFMSIIDWQLIHDKPVHLHQVQACPQEQPIFHFATVFHVMKSSAARIEVGAALYASLIKSAPFSAIIGCIRISVKVKPSLVQYEFLP